MGKSPIYSNSLKCIEVECTSMNWNKFYLDWPGIHLYSTFQVILPGIQSSRMKNFGGGKQFFSGGLFHFIEVE